MRKPILAIAISVLSVAAQAETLPIVVANVSDDELAMAHEIESGMIANRRCAGLTVTTNTHTTADHWSLVLPYYQLGAGKKYEWAMQKVVDGKSNSIVLRGSGTPAQIAEDVCVIAKGPGEHVQ